MPAPAADDGFTTRLIAKLRGARWPLLDETTKQAARRHLLDTVAVIHAGSREATAEVAEAALAAVRVEGYIPVLARARRSDVLDAAYVMAVAGHSLELDDGYRAGSTHPGVVVVPSALAVGAFVHASGEQVLAAVVAGYEAMTTIARVAHPALRRRGFHPTGTVGVFAAAAAAGSLLDLDEKQQRTALGLAASSAAGLFAFVEGGADVKRLHPGHAAREGIFSALLAQQGAEAPPRAIEGPNGFFAALADQQDVSGAAVGASWGITDCYIKPWPCCRHLHPAIDGALQILRERGFSGADIAAVEVETYRIAADHAAIPWTSFASAQLSFPFALATALIYGDVRLEHFRDEARSNLEVAALATRISIRASDAMDQRYRHERPSKITIILANGERLERDMPDALGAPSSPLDNRALLSRFLNLVGSVTDDMNARRIQAAWANIDEIDDIAPLVAMPM